MFGDHSIYCLYFTYPFAYFTYTFDCSACMAANPLSHMVLHVNCYWFYCHV